tara:strand:+ start:85 stop:978 length:894 start_codon:yes stop_codon:yes gene_type:complete
MRASQKSKICLKAYQDSGLSLPQIKFLLSVAKESALIGGKILKENYGRLITIENKDRIGDLVTNADIAAEQEIIQFLNKSTPEIQILAEESGINGERKQLTWCIDPLDGTTNFAHGYPFFATSIGLCFKDSPLLGSIYVPYLDELYYAAPEIGSYCNNQQINVSKTNKLINSLLVTGFAYDRNTVLDNNYAEFCWLTHITRGVRRGGAAAVDLAFIASGKLDGYWERGLSAWDMAAGVPLVELAGGIVKGYPDEVFCINNGRIIASTPGIENEFTNELKKVKPLKQAQYMGKHQINH